MSPWWFELDIHLRPDSSDIPESLAVWRKFRPPVPSQDLACDLLHWCSCHQPGQTGWVSHLQRWEEMTLAITCAMTKWLLKHVFQNLRIGVDRKTSCQSVALNYFILGQVIYRLYAQNWSDVCKDSSVEPGRVYKKTPRYLTKLLLLLINIL